MRLYSASSEETLRARQLLKEWRDDGFLTEVQYERLEKETVSDLRTTNLFLRLALFFFTLISVAASAGLWFAVFVSRPSQQTTGAFLLIFAVACYAAAEVAGSRLRLYRYGIEEALTVCSVAFLCAGMQAAFFSSILYSPHPDASQFLVPAAGAVFSLWIWHRFGLWYAFPAAMIFLIFLPNYSSFSHAAQHLTVAVFYASGLLCVAVARSRHHFDYLEKVYSLAEAFLWFGIYLAINLQISSLDLPARQWGGNRIASQFGRPFYWTTWVLIWCLPPLVLARGVRQKNRPVIAAGLIVAVLTLISNKPYLGWPRHTWDPMLLGVLLTGVAVFVRRWLDRGLGRQRNGYTAERLSGKDEHSIGTASAVFGLITPSSITPVAQTNNQGVRFGGGSSGGGGASSEF
ncbi:MAG: hypothetical protein ABR874_10565 [Candidatus Sulfotelmatobacter sp.]